ncbi:MAG: TIGR03560 family F420-dependent LLM class oxidoreductase [Anaerolinea sp.]|nr:TIGR03560 family F420-dependent LLM class oxidoreductase [Anaerolinea sp.]
MIGLMIEGQYGLTWDRWDRLLRAAERSGYQSVFRSDHYTEPVEEDHASLEAWVSLTYAATHTQTLEFGVLVSPITFRHPALLARMAAQVDDLSRGRLTLGMGTGWMEREHRNFGIPFPELSTRYTMLKDGLEVVTRLFLSDMPVTYQGEHFSLHEAILLPRPDRDGGPPILIGGNGKNKTLSLAAEYADEWNGVFIDAATYRDLNAHLNDLLAQRGRAPGEVTRSLMTRVIFAKDDAELQTIMSEMGQTLDELRRGGRALAGTPSMLVDQIGAYRDAGVERFMLQWLDLDDLDGIERMASDVVAHFRSN